MASRRILKDTVVLANYIGEVDDVATYQYTTIKNVYCYEAEGVNVSTIGRRGDDKATLFIFDTVSKAYDSEENKRSYLPYSLWKNLPDKSGFWTIGDEGYDTFRKIGTDKPHRITSFIRLRAGSSRMWHFEVEGE